MKDKYNLSDIILGDLFAGAVCGFATDLLVFLTLPLKSLIDYFAVFIVVTGIIFLFMWLLEFVFHIRGIPEWQEKQKEGLKNAE